MDLKRWMNFLVEKNEHYPISDDFVHSYQQRPNGNTTYIDFAQQVGKEINKYIAKPNQKWHFLKHT